MKLFKKVAAAVLAGVMALSMVACAPTGNNTDDKKEEVVVNTAAADEILSWLNAGRVQNEKDEFGNYKGGEKKAEELAKIENDAALKKQAEIILDQVIFDVTDTSRDNLFKHLGVLDPNGTLKYANGSFDKALLRDGGDTLAGAGVYYFTANGYVPIYNDINMTAVGYKLNPAQKETLKTKGATFVVAGKDDDCKVGIASKTIGSKTIVIMVASASAVAKL